MKANNLEGKARQEPRKVVRAHVPDYISVELTDGNIKKGSVLQIGNREELIIFVGVRDDGGFAQRKYFRTLCGGIGGFVILSDYRYARNNDAFTFEMYHKREIDPSEENPMDSLYYTDMLMEEAKR